MPKYDEFVTILLLASASGLFAYLVVAIVSSHGFLKRLDLFDRQALRPQVQRMFDFLFLGLVFSFFVLFAVTDLRKLETQSLFGVDFALLDQVIWNSLHGRLFENTLYLDAPIILGQRFSPILLAIVPLYTLGEGSRVLAILPAIAVSVSAFPLYWFARAQVGQFLAFVIVIAFLLSPGVQYLAVGQLYEIILALPMLMFALFFLLRYQYVPFLVCLGVALLCKEEVGFIAAGFGLYIFFVQRKWVLGFVIVLSSLSWVLALLLVVIPHFQGGTIYYFFGGSPGYSTGIYDYLGKSLSEILITAFTRPGLLLQHVFIASKIDVVLQLLLPLGFFPLLAGEVAALALPTLGYTLLSDAESMYLLGSHQYAPVFPFFLFGTVVGVRRVLLWIGAKSASSTAAMSPRSKMALCAALGIFILGVSFSSSNAEILAQLGTTLKLNQYSLSDHLVLGDVLARLVPAEATVVAQTELAPLVSERRRIYINSSIPCLGSADYVFVDKSRPWYEYGKKQWDEMLESQYFETIVQRDGYVLKKRAIPANHVDARFGDALTLVGYTLPLSNTVQGSQTLRPVAVWQINQQVRARYVVSVRVADSSGHVWIADEGEPGNGFCPTDSLGQGQMLSDQFELSLPPTIPTGNYQLTIGVYDKVTWQYLDARDAAGKSTGTELVITTLPIVKNKGSFTASELHIEQPLFVDMGEMRFLGYVPPRQTISPGELLQVGAYWRAREKPRGDYSVAVQLLDAAGNVAFDQSSRPANDTYPTTQWDAGEVLLDWHDFNLPKDIAPGAYKIFVVLRDAESQQVLGETKVSDISILP